MLSRLRLRQPPTRKKVIELAVRGPVGRWFARRNWAAFVLPLPFACLIFYWNTDAPDPFTRVHEFVHVEQDAEHPLWIVFWSSTWPSTSPAATGATRTSGTPAPSSTMRASTACPTGPRSRHLTSAGVASTKFLEGHSNELGNHRARAR